MLQATLATLLVASPAAGATTPDAPPVADAVTPELPAGLMRNLASDELLRLAQSGNPRGAPGAPMARPPRPQAGQPYSRQADHDQAMGDARNGEIQSLGQLMPKAQKVGRGELIGVEPDIERATYRFKYVRPGGTVVWVDMDGRTGKVIDVKD